MAQTPGMVTVVVRHVDAAKGITLGEFPPDALVDLVMSFKAHDIYSSDETIDLTMDDTQWVIETERAVFEIVLRNADEED